MEEKKFRVRLVRPVFQYVDVEVEAGEELEALSAALAGEEPFPMTSGTEFHPTGLRCRRCSRGGGSRH